MMLLNRIKSKQNFSDSELKIANYVNEFPQKVISMTIQELADVTYTSTSSVTRFCRKVDTEGFSELKLQLAKEINNFNLTDKRIEHDIPFQKEANQQEIAHNILNLNIQAILDTFSVLDLNQLERVAQQIVEARGIYFYGKGQSLILCEDFQYKLYRVGINAHLTPASDYQIMQSMTQPEGSLAIMISYFGIGQTNQSVVKILKNKQIPYILITGPQDNPLCQYAEQVIHVPPQEELMKKMASFSSRAAIQLVIDLIFAYVFSMNYDQNNENLDYKRWDT